MKKYFYTPVLVALLTAFTTVRAQDRQDYLGLPGDNLNLFAVMKLFQESETLESFERSLNDQNNYINNLDLNGDGYVDYIRVIDNVDRNAHFIVLQVAINHRENQDVAVFTVVREGNGTVTIQLVGDEALYGRNYIVEPIYDETPNPGYTGRANGNRVTVVRTNTYEVAAWPVIRFIYTPTYVVWRSPWYWDYYPVYWRPWNAYYWHHYYGYHYNYYSWYYGHYRHWNHHRYDHWHNTYYTHHHHHSPYVQTKIKEGYYKRSYSKPETRNEGAALYRRTRSAGGSSSTSVSNSSGRRTSSGGTVRESRSSTTRSREVGTSGTRGTSTRQATSTGTTRQSTSSGTKSTSGSDVRRATSTGGNRESSVRTETQSRPAGTSRQSSTSTSAPTKRGTATTTQQSSKRTESSARSSERRTSVSPGASKSSSSGQSVSRGTSQRSGSSATTGRNRSSESKSSGSSSGDTKSSEKSSRSTGRR